MVSCLTPPTVTADTGAEFLCPSRRPTHLRDSWSSWLRTELSPTAEAPSGSWLSWSSTSRPFSSAICRMRLSTCSCGVVSVVAELMESSITWGWSAGQSGRPGTPSVPPALSGALPSAHSPECWAWGTAACRAPAPAPGPLSPAGPLWASLDSTQGTRLPGGDCLRWREGADAAITGTPGLTYRRVYIQVLHLLLEPVHHCRDFLQVHGAECPVQGFGHLRHVLGHLAEAGLRRWAGPSGPMGPCMAHPQTMRSMEERTGDPGHGHLRAFGVCLAPA